MTHDKISFVKEYCRCRRIPYRMHGEQLTIGEGLNRKTFFSVYNLTYLDLIKEIDRHVKYDSTSTFYVRMV